jgi:hypothetical protein
MKRWGARTFWTLGYMRINWQTAPMAGVDLRAAYQRTLPPLNCGGTRKMLISCRLIRPYALEDRE